MSTPSSPSSTSSSDSAFYSSDTSASSWTKPYSSSWTGVPSPEFKALIQKCNIISMEDRRRRVVATKLNVPYNPQSSLLRLLNNSRIRHLVTNFYYGKRFLPSDKMLPEDILRVFSPVTYLVQLHCLNNRPANRPLVTPTDDPHPRSAGHPLVSQLASRPLRLALPPTIPLLANFVRS